MIKNNVHNVLSEIKHACKQIGRNPKEVTVVAVTKFASLEAIQEAIDAGITHIAENRVREAQMKFPPLLAKNPGLQSHIIGHVQTNKAKGAIKICSLIQSVDGLKLAHEIERQAAKNDQGVAILVQLNTAREAQKFGVAPEKAYSLVEAISQLAHVEIKGLMCMAPYTKDERVIRKAFVDLREIRDGIKRRFSGDPKVGMGILSMGMSGDYQIAIEEGSTMVRIGSAIFR